MANEAAKAFTWLYTTMTADTALMAAAVGGVWRDVADLTTPPPLVIMNRQAGSDTLTASAIRLMAQEVFQIKALGPASTWAALTTIADRIDALFNSVRVVTVAGTTILAAYREQTIAYSENIDGVTWNHLGGLYRVIIQAQ